MGKYTVFIFSILLILSLICAENVYEDFSSDFGWIQTNPDKIFIDTSLDTVSFDTDTILSKVYKNISHTSAEGDIFEIEVKAISHSDSNTLQGVFIGFTDIPHMNGPGLPDNFIGVQFVNNWGDPMIRTYVRKNGESLTQPELKGYGTYKLKVTISTESSFNVQIKDESDRTLLESGIYEDATEITFSYVTVYNAQVQSLPIGGKYEGSVNYLKLTAGDSFSSALHGINHLGTITYSQAPKTWTVTIPDDFILVQSATYSPSNLDQTNRFGGWNAYMKVNEDYIWKFKGTQGGDGLIHNYILSKDVLESTGKNKWLDITSMISAGENTITYYHYTSGDGAGIKLNVYREGDITPTPEASSTPTPIPVTPTHSTSVIPEPSYKPICLEEYCCLYSFDSESSCEQDNCYWGSDNKCHYGSAPTPTPTAVPITPSPTSSPTTSALLVDGSSCSGRSECSSNNCVNDICCKAGYICCKFPKDCPPGKTCKSQFYCEAQATPTPTIAPTITVSPTTTPAPSAGKVTKLGTIKHSQAPKTWTVTIPDDFAKVEIAIYGKDQPDVTNQFGGWNAYVKVNEDFAWKFKGTQSGDGLIHNYILGKEVLESTGKNKWLDITPLVKAGDNTLTYYHYTSGGGAGLKMRVFTDVDITPTPGGSPTSSETCTITDFTPITYSEAPKTWTITIPDSFSTVEIGCYHKEDQTIMSFGGWKAYLMVNDEFAWKFYNADNGGMYTDYITGLTVPGKDGKGKYKDITSLFKPGENAIKFYHYNEGEGIGVKVKICGSDSFTPIVSPEISPVVTILPTIIPEITLTPTLYPSATQKPEESDKKITIVTYIDLYDPFTYQFYNTLAKIRNEYEDKVDILLRHFPLKFHKHAFLAATMTECARDQGKFLKMVEAIFADPNTLSRGSVEKYVKIVKLDKEPFQICLKEQLKDDLINENIKKGQQKGIRGTPTFFINNKKFTGAMPYKNLKKIIEEILNPLTVTARPIIATPTPLPPTIIKYILGQSCEKDSDCQTNHCVHNVCRRNAFYCGDNFCDTEAGESCACQKDCGCEDGGCCIYSKSKQFICINNKEKIDSTFYCCESRKYFGTCPVKPTQSIGDTCSKHAECYSQICCAGICSDYCPECGNKLCERKYGENCNECPSDCGCNNGFKCSDNKCVSACGDGVIDSGETCYTCWEDNPCEQGTECRSDGSCITPSYCPFKCSSCSVSGDCEPFADNTWYKGKLSNTQTFYKCVYGKRGDVTVSLDVCGSISDKGKDNSRTCYGTDDIDLSLYDHKRQLTFKENKGKGKDETVVFTQDLDLINVCFTINLNNKYNADKAGSEYFIKINEAIEGKICEKDSDCLKSEICGLDIDEYKNYCFTKDVYLFKQISKKMIFDYHPIKGLQRYAEKKEHNLDVYKETLQSLLTDNSIMFVGDIASGVSQMTGGSIIAFAGANACATGLGCLFGATGVASGAEMSYAGYSKITSAQDSLNTLIKEITANNYRLGVELEKNAMLSYFTTARQNGYKDKKEKQSLVCDTNEQCALTTISQGMDIINNYVDDGFKGVKSGFGPSALMLIANVAVNALDAEAHEIIMDDNARNLYYLTANQNQAILAYTAQQLFADYPHYISIEDIRFLILFDAAYWQSIANAYRTKEEYHLAKSSKYNIKIRDSIFYGDYYKEKRDSQNKKAKTVNQLAFSYEQDAKKSTRRLIIIELVRVQCIESDNFKECVQKYAKSYSQCSQITGIWDNDFDDCVRDVNSKDGVFNG